MNEGNKQRRELLKIDAVAVGALALISLGAYFLAVGPMLDARAERAAHEASLHRQLAAADELAAAASTLAKRLERYRAELEESALRLSPASRLNERLASLTELVAQHQLELHGIVPGQPGYTDRYGALPISIRGTGSFENGLRFLRALNREFWDLSVDAITLTGAPEEQDSNPLFEFSLVWFVLPTERDS